MVAFYAPGRQRDDPGVRGKPVAVVGSSRRGVVAAASYEARKFGVRSAMPSVTAKRQCPALIFVPPRFEVYRDISHQIRAIFRDYADGVERSEEHTSELQSLIRLSYAVFCLKKKKSYRT